VLRQYRFQWPAMDLVFLAGVLRALMVLLFLAGALWALGALFGKLLRPQTEREIA
jgi:hypothetical protein